MMAQKFLIGIDLGGTNLKLGLFDSAFKLKGKRVLGTVKYPNKAALIQGISKSVRQIIADFGLKNKDILGIGLGVPGPVDIAGGIVYSLTNIPGWKNVPLRRILKKELRLPVFLDNDAKLMCLAEARLGAARRVKDALCVTLGTGVGGGLIFGGKIYRGANFAAGEIGHAPVNEYGPRCNCGGRGCLEVYVGNRVILRQAKKILKRPVSLEEVTRLAKKGNKRALGIWSEAGVHLGIALTGAVNLLNLEAIVIGGGVAEAGSVLFDKIRKTVSARAMAVQGKNVRIYKSKLGPDAGLVGAAVFAEESLRHTK